MSKSLVLRIIQDVLEVEKDLGHFPERDEYDAKGKYGALIAKHFGGWNGVLRAISRRRAEEKDASREPKILLFDLETAPMELWGFGMFDQNFSPSQIKRDWFLLSFAAKWLGNPAIFYTDLRGDKFGDDRRALKVLWHLLDQADIVVTQNGKSFDEKMANTRFVMLDMGEPSPFQHIDTKRLAKRKFRFPSNSLEYLGNALGVDVKKSVHKKFPGFLLWKAALENNPEAWEEMHAYNVADVLSLEGVYLKLRGWGTPGVNLNLFYSEAKYRCESCGSQELRFDRTQAKGSAVYLQFQCQKCGKWGAKKGAGNNLLSDHKKASLKGPE